MAMQSTTTMVLTTLLLSVVVVVTQAAGGGNKYDRGGKANDNLKVENMVVEACKNMSKELFRKEPHFDEEPCASVLRSDMRSMVARDHGDLVFIALDLLEHRSNELMAKIDNILRGLPMHNWTQRAFQFCSADYASIVRNLPGCRDLFLDVKPLGTKTPWGKAMWALQCVGSLGVPAHECEIRLLNHWDYDQAQEFSDYLNYISLAWGLMQMATGCRDDRSQW